MRLWPLIIIAILFTLALGGCPAAPPADDGGDQTPAKPRHERIFTEIVPAGYEGTQSCLTCHSDKAQELMTTAHWTWEGVSDRVDGLAGQVIGKNNLINNFCLAVASNEGRCMQCHPSYGWKSKAFDRADMTSIDCLVCHDTTGTYKKHPTADGGGGPPALMVNGELTVVGAAQLQNVAYNVGKPTRANCGACHFYAGGDDNVKHGDLSSNLISPTRDMDVHMGGRDFACQTCHQASQHGIAGQPIHHVAEGGASPDCTRCHGTENVHRAERLETPVYAAVLNQHSNRVHCTVCHIPAFARSMPTKMEWYWSEAGQDISPIPTDQYGKQLYDKKKGRFVFAQNVRPTYLWFDGQWSRKVVGLNDTYTEAGTPEDPIILAAPTATFATPGAKLYPFKAMRGNQPIDPLNRRLLVPHLFGGAAGPNAFWAKYDWLKSLQEGTLYAGQPFADAYDFAYTVMYLRVSHEVAPASEALRCGDCHQQPGFFEQLGYDKDPFPL